MKFNSNEVEIKNDFGRIPDGDYDLTIVEAIEMSTKKGGKMIKIQLDIDGPSSSGRKIWDYINTENANPVAVDIGRERLAMICRSAGIESFDHEQELEGRSVKAHIGIDPRNPDFNKIAWYILPGEAKPVAHEDKPEMNEDIPF